MNRSEVVMRNQLHALRIAAAVAAVLVIGVPIGAQRPPPAKPAGKPNRNANQKGSAALHGVQRQHADRHAGVTEIVDRALDHRRGADEAPRPRRDREVGRGRSAETARRAAEDQAARRVHPNAEQHRLGSPIRGRTAMPDGTRQLVIATDKPVSFAAAASGGGHGLPFTLVEMRMKPNEKGEGKMLAATSITIKNGRMELENYGQEPVRLTEITEKQKEKK